MKHMIMWDDSTDLFDDDDATEKEMCCGLTISADDYETEYVYAHAPNQVTCEDCKAYLSKAANHVVPILEDIIKNDKIAEDKKKSKGGFGR